MKDMWLASYFSGWWQKWWFSDLILSASPSHAGVSSYIYTQIVPDEHSPCLLASLSLALSECRWFNSRLTSVFWLEDEPCPRTSSMFIHWGHGLCSCRYHSYLSVMSRSLGMDRYSPSPHGHGNTIHGTRRMTHRPAVGKCFLFSSKSPFHFLFHGAGCDRQTLFFTAQVLISVHSDVRD